MLDYGPYYVLYKLKKLRAQVAYLLGAMSHINVVTTSTAKVIIRDTQTLPTEPPPDDVTVVTLLFFRDGSVSKVWDIQAEPPTWI